VPTERADVRPYALPPLERDERYLVAVYDVEVEPVRVDLDGAAGAGARHARWSTSPAASGTS
jgi:hypothetical protein